MSAPPPFEVSIHEEIEGAAEPTGWLDVARVVAMVAVVIVHVCAPAVTGEVPEGTLAWWLANLLDSASRWCVPVFIMASGALLLDPRRTERPRDMYRRRLARIGVPLVVWTAGYLAFRRWWLNPNLDPQDAARDVLAGSPFLQLYFLVVLLGLYALAPFLRIVVRNTTRRMQAGFAAVLMALGLFDHALATLGGVGEPNAATRFLPFAGYFVAGWVVRDAPRTWLRRPAVLAATAASVLTTALLAGVASSADGWGTTGRYAYGFLSPNVVVMSVAVFALFRLTGGHVGRDSRWRALAGLSFGVFLVHPLVLYPLQAAWTTSSEAAQLIGELLAQTAITLAGSVLAVAIIARVPYLRALVT